MSKKSHASPIITLLGLPIIVAAGCQSGQGIDEPQTLSAESFDQFAADRTANLWIKGITCPFCVQNIDQRISSLDGVDQVQVDLKSGQVRVLLSPNNPAAEDDLVSAIGTSGFTLDRIEMP